MAYNPDLAIDLEKVIAERTGGKKVPHFVVRALEKFLHVDLMNGLLVQGYEGQEFLDKAVEYLDVKAEIKGLDRIDTSSGRKYTFVSNHPLGGIDGVILASNLGKLFPDVKMRFQVNDFLMNIPGIRDVSVPVSKTGAQSRDLPRLINEYYSSDDQLLIFPAGMCSRRIDGRIQDLPWRKTFITKSVQNGRWIVPIHFIGENSRRFYRVANICKALHTKFNFAMTFLPDEMARGMHKTFRVVVGEPIPPEFFDSSKTASEWAEWTRQEVYKLQ